MRRSYLYNGNSLYDKTAFLYWDCPQTISLAADICYLTLPFKKHSMIAVWTSRVSNPALLILYLTYHYFAALLFTWSSPPALWCLPVIIVYRKPSFVDVFIVSCGWYHLKFVILQCPCSPGFSSVARFCSLQSASSACYHWVTSGPSQLQLNWLAPGEFDYSLKLVNLKLISTINILSIFWSCYQVNAKTPHWSLVNIGSGNGLVPSGNKPLPEPMLT